LISDKRAGCAIGSRLSEGDLEQIRDHYFDLTPDDRLNRFGGFISDNALDRYVGSIDFNQKLVLGRERIETGKLVGLVELWFDNPQHPVMAEIAVSVESGWRRQGIGVQLVADAAHIAFARGATQVELHFEPSNRATKSIVRKLGGKRGVFEGKAGLAAPIPIAA